MWEIMRGTDESNDVRKGDKVTIIGLIRHGSTDWNLEGNGGDMGLQPV